MLEWRTGFIKAWKDGDAANKNKPKLDFEDSTRGVYGIFKLIDFLAPESAAGDSPADALLRKTSRKNALALVTPVIEYLRFLKEIKDSDLPRAVRVLLPHS